MEGVRACGRSDPWPARARRRTNWLAVVAWCPPSSSASAPATARLPPPPQPQTITDKGTPFGDLLVPKLTASVTDGAVGVTVDAPVTVSAEDGVLGAVTMTNDDGRARRGPAQPRRSAWTTTEPLGYNKQYTLNAQSLGLGGVTSRSMTFETHSPENLTMPYLLPNDGEVVGVGQPVAVRFDENVPEPSRGGEGDHRHDQPAGRGRVLLAEQPRSALAPSRLTGSRARRSTSR